MKRIHLSGKGTHVIRRAGNKIATSITGLKRAVLRGLYHRRGMTRRLPEVGVKVRHRLTPRFTKHHDLGARLARSSRLAWSGKITPEKWRRIFTAKPKA